MITPIKVDEAILKARDDLINSLPVPVKASLKWELIQLLERAIRKGITVGIGLSDEELRKNL